jgi:hypothetical protein
MIIIVSRNVLPKCVVLCALPIIGSKVICTSYSSSFTKFLSIDLGASHSYSTAACKVAFLLLAIGAIIPQNIINGQAKKIKSI